MGFFFIGLLYASFLAWDEERDELVRLTAKAAERETGEGNPFATLLSGPIHAQREHTAALGRHADEIWDRMERQLRDLIPKEDVPRFESEITAVVVDDDHEQPDWIKLYIYLVVRNQGMDSAIDRWTLKVVPPQPAPPFIQTEKGQLSDSQQGHDGRMGGNLLHDREIIKRGGGKGGWLLCRGPKDQMGLSTGQRPAVKVSFMDVHNNEYSVIDPPNLRRAEKIVQRARYHEELLRRLK
jgi:hypothetical protein